MMTIIRAAFITAATSMAALAIVSTAHAAVGVSLNFGAIGYQDGYYDSHHRWHHWRHHNDWQAYRDAHPDHYRDYRHDRDEHPH